MDEQKRLSVRLELTDGGLRRGNGSASFHSAEHSEPASFSAGFEATDTTRQNGYAPKYSTSASEQASTKYRVSSTRVAAHASVALRLSASSSCAVQITSQRCGEMLRHSAVSWIALHDSQIVCSCSNCSKHTHTPGLSARRAVGAHEQQQSIISHFIQTSFLLGRRPS